MNMKFNKKTVTLGALGIFLIIGGIVAVLIITLSRKRKASGIAPGIAPGVAPGIAPGIAPGVAPGVAPGITPGGAFPVRIWISTYTDVFGVLNTAQLASYYDSVFQFSNTFNVKFKQMGVSITGIWICVANPQADISPYIAFSQKCTASGIRLGVVLSPGDGTSGTLAELLGTFISINAACGNAFTHVNFDSQTITTLSNDPNLVTTYLTDIFLPLLRTTDGKLTPAGSVIEHISVSGGHQLTGNAITPPNMPCPVTGIFEFYSFGSGSSCVDPGTGCTPPTPAIQDVVANWWAADDGKPFSCIARLTISDFFQNASGSSWPAISCASTGCAEGCLIGAYDKSSMCQSGDDGASQSFAAYGLEKDIVGTPEAPGLLLQFASKAQESAVVQPFTELNVVLYESAFLPVAWFTELGIKVTP